MPILTAPKKSLRTEKIAVHIVAAWLFISGLVSIGSAVVEVQEASRASVLYFGNTTAWLSQHGIATGIMLLYISRHLWRGERRAWQIALLLIGLEIVKYSLVTPHLALLSLYSLTAVAIIWCRDYFDRRSYSDQLSKRLGQFLLVSLGVIGTLVLSVLLLEFKQHHSLYHTPEHLWSLIQHLFWLNDDVQGSIGHMGRQLLGQVINVAGLGLLITLLVALFQPRRLRTQQTSETEQNEIVALLETCGQSCEDYFKIWPQPKRYFWNGARTAAITYDVAGNVAFVLGEPVGKTTASQHHIITDFITYCRHNGWRACFILISEQQKASFETSDLKLFRIGATATVNVANFTKKTSRNKWWRWVLNKANRQNMTYQLAEPPHSTELLSNVKAVSDAWLKHSGHDERGFAMGFYDADYLQACRLHILNEGDRMVAFANELPRYNKNPTSTIDLMRHLPNANHAMPALLAQTIQQLATEPGKENFDLGFVPLAGGSSKSEQAIKKLSQFFIREAIPSSGLEQFKNKFDPTWENTYIAFDGDWLDLVHVSRYMDKLLRP